MSEYLTINPAEVQTKVLHGHLLSAVGPRPIGFISTISRDGTPNLAPFSFFNVFSANPPIAIFSPARRVRDNTTKHTLKNVYQVPEAVVNVVSHEIVEQMNLASGEYGDGVNEFEKAGLTMLSSDLIAPPRVGESPVQMECKVVEIKPLADTKGAGQLVFCQVLRMHIKTDILGEDGRIDMQKIDLVGRMGGLNYVRAHGDAIFEVAKPLAPGIGIDSLPEGVRTSEVLTANQLGLLGNLPAHPTQEEMVSFRASAEDLLAQSNGNHHEAAAKLIQEGKVKEALMILLGP